MSWLLWALSLGNALLAIFYQHTTWHGAEHEITAIILLVGAVINDSVRGRR